MNLILLLHPDLVVPGESIYKNEKLVSGHGVQKVLNVGKKIEILGIYALLRSM